MEAYRQDRRRVVVMNAAAWARQKVRFALERQEAKGRRNKRT
jgi:hypothetical protein